MFVNNTKISFEFIISRGSFKAKKQLWNVLQNEFACQFLVLTRRKEEDEIVFEMKPATDLYRHSKTQQKINCTLPIHWVFTGLLHAALWQRTFEKVELKKDHVEAEITQKLMMKWEPVWMRSLMRIVSWLLTKLTKSFEEDKQQNLKYMTGPLQELLMGCSYAAK